MDRLISEQAVIDSIEFFQMNPQHFSFVNLIDDIKEIPSAELKWIPVSERLPEEETAVLISCEDLYLHRLNPCIGWRNGQYWNTFTANGCKQILYPTAWMPLPKPYEPQERSEE